MIRRRCACAIRRNARARNYRAFRIFDLRKAPRDFDSAAFTPVTRPSRSFHFARASANARCVARSAQASIHAYTHYANPEHAHQVIFVGSRLNILLSMVGGPWLSVTPALHPTYFSRKSKVYFFVRVNPLSAPRGDNIIFVYASIEQ